MRLEACLFDLDGVLVDTAQFHYMAWKRLANSLGFDFSAEQNEQLKGISRMDSLVKILNWGNLSFAKDKLEELATLKNQWYITMISDMSELDILPGALQLLRELKMQNINIGLGSASKNAQLILLKTGLMPYFDVIVDGTIVNKSKPDPEVFLRGAELLAIEPRSCVVFEDASAGVEAGLLANMKVVGVGSPIKLNNAHIVVNDLKAIDYRSIHNLF